MRCKSPVAAIALGVCGAAYGGTLPPTDNSTIGFVIVAGFLYPAICVRRLFLPHLLTGHGR